MVKMGAAATTFMIAASACMTGTSTPGVRNCVNVFIVVGFYQSCERGPDWTKTVDSPPQPETGPPPPMTTDMPMQRTVQKAAGDATRDVRELAAEKGDPTKGGFWCSGKGELGRCAATPTECETDREFANQARTPDEQFGVCEHQGFAICAPSGCYPTPAACLFYERRAKRDGSWCAAKK